MSPSPNLRAGLDAAESIRRFVRSRTDLRDTLRAQAAALNPRVFAYRVREPDAYLDVYLEEAVTLLRDVFPRLCAASRVLEIGGGLGLFHVIAKAAGATIISIEPSGQGFSGFRAFAVPLMLEFGGVASDFPDLAVEEMAWDSEFDLIVSANVLEHVRDPQEAIRRCYRALLPGGYMRHTCPNYLFPYDPHFRIPVLPGALALTKRLVPSLASDELWQSLNGIDSRLVRRTAAELGAEVHFVDGLGVLLDRLAESSNLAERHGRLGSIVRLRPVSSLLRLLPSEWMSPMTFELCKSENN